MAYRIDKKLVIAVSSSAVFDMVAANLVFENEGEDAYRKYQLQHIDDPFAPGVAFQFIKRLLHLNKLYAAEEPVEVVVLSRNDPDSGRRFYRSCQHHGLNITRGVFLSGKSPYPYIPAFNASLFLSATKKDVVAAVQAQMPAGLVLPTKAQDDENDKELRIAFDFDGVLCDDEAEIIYREQNLERFQESEVKKAAIPHNPGPLKDLITKIAFFQKLEAKKAKENPAYKPALRIAIISARNAPANERLVTTLNAWKITAAETFLLGGIEKKRILDILKPHIFFDDQLVHLAEAASNVPSVHIPFGIANRQGSGTVAPTEIVPTLNQETALPKNSA
jgi:5'-nucleotidase